MAWTDVFLVFVLLVCDVWCWAWLASTGCKLVWPCMYGLLILRMCLLTHAAQGDCSTCLHVACGAGHLDVVKYLCEHGGKELLMKLRYVRAILLVLVDSCVGLVWFSVLKWDMRRILRAYACVYKQTKGLCVCMPMQMHM